MINSNIATLVVFQIRTIIDFPDHTSITEVRSGCDRQPNCRFISLPDRNNNMTKLQSKYTIRTTNSSGRITSLIVYGLIVIVVVAHHPQYP
jgi:hypothetical protein